MSMIHYISLHVESARAALKELLRQPIGTLLTLLMLAVAMTLPLFMYLGIQSGQSVLGKLNESPQITVYMDTDAAGSDADTVKNLLQRDSRIDKVRFISKQEGLEELQTNLDQNLVSMLDGNPLPDVFIVTPDPPLLRIRCRPSIKTLPNCRASNRQPWIPNGYKLFIVLTNLIRKILWFLLADFGHGLCLGGTQHHPPANPQPQGRAGNHPSYWVRPLPSSAAPFLYQAMWQSIFSAAVSLGLCGWLLSAVRPLVDAIFKPYGLNIGWRFFHFSEVSLVFGFVIALGVFGAWLATTQHLLGFRAKK